MPPRNYQFQGPQTGEEAFFGGMGEAVGAADERRRTAKADAQKDALFALQMQAVLDELNRGRLEAGAEPITFDVGAQAGAGRVPGTPGFNPEADTPTTGGAGGGGFMERLRGLRARVGAGLGLEMDEYTPPTPRGMTQVGPSRAEKIVGLQTASAEGISAADNDAAMQRLAVMNRAMLERLGLELGNRREIAGLTHKDVATQVNLGLAQAMGSEIDDYNISIDRLNEQLKVPIAERAIALGNDLEKARREAATLQRQLAGLVAARDARVLQRQQVINGLGGVSLPQPRVPQTPATAEESRAIQGYLSGRGQPSAPAGTRSPLSYLATSPEGRVQADEATLSDADLWEKKVDEGMTEQQATEYVRNRVRR